MKSINLLGLRVDNVTMQEAVEKIEDFILTKRPHICVTLDFFDSFREAKNDPMFYEVVNSADLVIPDAMTVIWLSKILGMPLKERVTGLDLTIKLCELSGKKGYKLYLLGSTDEVLAKTVKIIKNKYRAKVAGTYSPSFGPWDGIEEEMINDINKKSPDILLVATGIGKGEKWLYKNLKRLNVPFCMQIGGTFDTICGSRKRAPLWMQRIGLEGFFYIVCQPWRIKRVVASIKTVLPDIVKAVITRTSNSTRRK